MVLINLFASPLGLSVLVLRVVIVDLTLLPLEELRAEVRLVPEAAVAGGITPLSARPPPYSAAPRVAVVKWVGEWDLYLWKLSTITQRVVSVKSNE